MEIENTKKCIKALKAMGYTQRSVNFMFAAEIKDTNELKDYSAKDIKKFRNIGKGTIENILKTTERDVCLTKHWEERNQEAKEEKIKSQKEEVTQIKLSEQQEINRDVEAKKDWLLMRSLSYEVARVSDIIRFYVREPKDWILSVEGNQYYTRFLIYNKNKNKEFQGFSVYHNPRNYKLEVTCYIHDKSTPEKIKNKGVKKGILPEFKELLKDYDYLLIIK